MNNDKIVLSRLLRFPVELQALEKFGVLKTVTKNTMLIEAGDVPKYCYLVKKGCIIGFEYSSCGDERVYNIMLPGSLLMEANLILNEPSPVFFKAVKFSILICIDRSTLLKQMRNDFNISTGIVKYISNKFLAAMEQVREKQCHDATWRLCSVLLMFAEYFGILYEGEILIKEKLSQQILADILGVNRITVNRIINKLKKMDLVVQINSYYCIRSITSLEKHMSYLEDGGGG
jgi:CRP/FNR family transcriptional regulator